MNLLRLDDSDLVPVDYGDLLDKILEVLQSKNPFNISDDRRRLIVDIDAIAADVAKMQVRTPLGSFERQADAATVNFPPEVEELFGSQITQIQQCLRQQLESILGQNVAIEKFVNSLTSLLDSFKGNGSQLGFKYDFDKKHYNLQKKKLTLEPLGTGSDSLLKFHKVTISVGNANIFQQELQEGLKNYIDEKAQTEDDNDELNRLLQEMLSDETSSFHRLVRIVDKETLGQLKKEAKITYLEYILANVSPDKANDRGCIYLKDLIRRLRLILPSR
ncbi:hypothetical protein [Microcoleus sp. Pol10D4]|uniref:hypothetical protein n=1 Tax=Microcoleus sp. Pol10D4 TaxID=3055387 RepID=UPI002FD3F613